MSKERAGRLIALLDLTSLNDDDTPETIEQLCQKAMTPYGSVAAVCLYPQFIVQAKEALQGSGVRVATVVNFPKGDQPLPDCVAAIRRVLADGADEVDIVMPYTRYLQGETSELFEFIRGCVAACAHHATLKVILETGALGKSDLIQGATRLAIEAGVDFVKTSTGKIDVGATPSAAENMLRVIHAFPEKTVGFKAAGGIRTVDQANEYVQLAETIMGQSWVSSGTLRLGASSLLDAILAEMNA